MAHSWDVVSTLDVNIQNLFPVLTLTGVMGLDIVMKDALTSIGSIRRLNG